MIKFNKPRGDYSHFANEIFQLQKFDINFFSHHEKPACRLCPTNSLYKCTFSPSPWLHGTLGQMTPSVTVGTSPAVSHRNTEIPSPPVPIATSPHPLR